MKTTDKDAAEKVDLVSSLREAVDYATTAGLLKDASALAALDSAEAAQKRGDQPDHKAVSEALNNMVAMIAPLTLADLHFDRNPLSPANQARTRKFQFWLPVLALVLLVLIGYFMQSLRHSQSFIARVERVQGQNPDQKLAALLQLILFDKSLDTSNPKELKRKQYLEEPMREQYLEKRADLQRLTTELVSLSSQVEVLAPELSRIASGQPVLVYHLKRLVASVNSLWSSPPQAAPAALPAVPTKAPVAGEAAAMPFCQATKSGELELPAEWLNWPPWMQRMAADDLRNFCFKLQLQRGQGDEMSPDLGAIVPKLINAVPTIKDRIALRSEWILPFLYGLLGSMLFMMRTVGNIRLPAMQAMSILMRIALGGMAGIVIGWFSISEPGAQSQMTSAIAWPFVLAFVSGYGIEALFSVLDRMNRFIADTTYTKRDGGTGTS